MKRLRERFERLVERRCERFGVRDFRGKDVMVGKVVESDIEGPNCPHLTSSLSDNWRSRTPTRWLVGFESLVVMI